MQISKQSSLLGHEHKYTNTFNLDIHLNRYQEPCFVYRSNSNKSTAHLFSQLVYIAFFHNNKGKGKGMYTRYSTSSWNTTSEALRYGMCSQGISVLSAKCTPSRSSIAGDEPYLPLPSQLPLVLIYRPRRDGRLSWPGWLVTSDHFSQNLLLLGQHYNTAL